MPLGLDDTTAERTARPTGGDDAGLRPLAILPEERSLAAPSVGEIRDSRMESIARSLWNVDATELDLQLEGIRSLPDIQAVSVAETSAGAEAIEVSLGDFDGRYYQLKDARCEPKPIQKPHPPFTVEVADRSAQAVDGGRIVFGETHAFLGRRYLVTIRHGASASYAPVRAREEREPELLSLGPSYCLYVVLDAIVDNYLPIVDEFRATLGALEKDVFAEEFHRETVVRLYELKRELTRLRLAVAPLQDILAQLTRQHGELVRDEVRPYFRDVLDHALRVNESTDTMREMLTAALSVNLSLVTVAQGEIVKKLAGWAALLAAPTLIASWYGMNFEFMPELHGRHSYWVLIGGVAVVVAGLYAYLRKVKWL